MDKRKGATEQRKLYIVQTNQNSGVNTGDPKLLGILRSENVFIMLLFIRTYIVIRQGCNGKTNSHNKMSVINQQSPFTLLYKCISDTSILNLFRLAIEDSNAYRNIEIKFSAAHQLYPNFLALSYIYYFCFTDRMFNQDGRILKRWSKNTCWKFKKSATCWKISPKTI